MFFSSTPVYLHIDVYNIATLSNIMLIIIIIIIIILKNNGISIIVVVITNIARHHPPTYMFGMQLCDDLLNVENMVSPEEK